MAIATAFKDPRTLKVTSISQVNYEDDGAIVNFVEGRWQRRDWHRGRLEKQWFTNVAQYLGYQHHVLDNITGTLTLPRAPSWRVRLVCNRLMLISRKMVSKAMRQRPTWTVIPATSDAEDARVSRVSEKLLKYYWKYLNMDRTMVDLFTWTSITGNAFIRVYWDPTKREEISVGPEEAQGLGAPELGQLKQLGGKVNLGDIQIEVCSPFEIDVDPEALRMEEVSHLIHSKIKNKDYLETRYGVSDLTPDASDSSVLARYYEKRIQNMTGLWGVGGSEKNEDEEQNSVLTHTLWVNPTERMRDGFFAVVASGRVLTKGPLPNPFKRIPYAHVAEVPVPGRFWGSCCLEQCIGLQSDYNRARSQLCENRNLMTRPKWLKPKGSGISNQALTDEPGEIVEYIYPLKPEPSQPPQIPEWFFRNLEYGLKDMEDVSGVHEVTQARAPSGVRSGVAIAQLQEMDDQMLAPTFLMAEKALQSIGAWSLQLLSQNVNEERVIRIVGKDKEIESLTFTGKSLFGPNLGTPGVNYFDVEVQMSSQLPLTANQRRQYAIDLVNAGILNPEADRKKIFEILDLGTEEPALNDEALDRQAANRENIQLMQGIQIEPNPWDDDLVHLDTHTRFEKQPEFLTLSKVNPIAVQAVEMHKQLHALRIQPPLPPMGPEPPVAQEGPPTTKPNEVPLAPAAPSLPPPPQEIPGV